MSIHSTGRPADGLIPNQKDVVAATVERDPDVWLTPAQADYFLHTGEDLWKVARLSEAAAVGRLAGAGRCRQTGAPLASAFVPMSSDAGPEERTAALKAAKEQLRVSRESPFLAATKCRDHFLGTGQAVAQGRRTPWALHKTIGPVEFCDLTVAGPNLVNRRGEIAFYDVRISGRDLWELRQAAVAAIAAAEIKPVATAELPTLAPIQPQQSHQRQRGPKPGRTGFKAADDALCPEIDDMMRTARALWASDAARILAMNDRVAGGGMLKGGAERQAGNKATPVKFADSTPTGGEAVSCETTIQKTATRRKGGRKPGSGRINDDSILLDMLRLLAAEQATSAWNAAGKFANGNENLQRRYQKHFKQKWGLEPPPSKTWKGVLEDVERKLNTN